MNIDDLIYLRLASSFPDDEGGKILDIIDEFEQEVWQKYLALKREFVGGSKAEASHLPQLPQLPYHAKPRFFN